MAQIENTPIDPGFAQRSARYLAKHGLDTQQIEAALVEELELAPDSAHTIVLDLAA